jgi:hypothetical protein
LDRILAKTAVWAIMQTVALADLMKMELFIRQFVPIALEVPYFLPLQVYGLARTGVQIAIWLPSK